MRNTFVTAAVTAIACFLDTDAKAFEDCPETSIFPKLVGLAKEDNLTENLTELTAIDYCEDFEFVVAGGQVKYVDSSNDSPKLRGLERYCNGLECVSDVNKDYQWHQATPTNALLQFYSLNSYQQKYNFVITGHDGTQNERVKGVKVLQMDSRQDHKETRKIYSSNYFQYDLEKEVLVAVLLKFSNYNTLEKKDYLMLISVDMTNTTAPVVQKRAYELTVFDTDSKYGHPQFMSFGELYNSAGDAMGPTLILIKKQDSKSATLKPSVIVYQLQPDADSVYMTGLLNDESILDSSLVIQSTRTHPKGKDIYLLGTYTTSISLSSGLVDTHYPIMMKVQLEVTTDNLFQFLVIETFMVNNLAPHDTLSNEYIDVSWIANPITSNNNTEVLLRHTSLFDEIETGYSSDLGIVVDIRYHDASPSTYRSIELSADGSNVIPDLKAHTIRCEGFTCLIVMQKIKETSYGKFKLITIGNLGDNDSAQYTINMESLTDNLHQGATQLLQDAIVYSLNDTLTAFFTYTTELISYDCGAGCDGSDDWYEVEYLTNPKQGVSIIVSSRAEDCIGVLDDGVSNSKSLMRSTGSVMTNSATEKLANVLTQKTTGSEVSNDLRTYDNVEDIMLMYKQTYSYSATAYPQQLVEPWFDCEVVANPVPADFVFEYNASDPDFELTFGGATVVSTDTGKCIDKIFEAPLLDIRSQVGGQLATLMTDSIQANKVINSDTTELTLKLPKDSPDYDGQELFFRQTIFTSTSPQVQSEEFKITWKHLNDGGAQQDDQQNLAPQFTDPIMEGKEYTVRVGDQYDEHFILEPSIDADSIKVTLIVDGEKVDSQYCDQCPVTLSDQNKLVITARDEDFEDKIIVESTLSGGTFQQAIQIPCTIELYSEVSQLKTIYSFTVILSRETETSIYPEDGDDADGQVDDSMVDDTTEDPTINDEDDNADIGEDSDTTQNETPDNVIDGEDVTDYISDAIGKIVSIQDDEALLAIELGKLMQTENVDKVIARSQRVTKIEDDTDLEQAAKFDFLEYLKSRGIKPSWQEENMPPLIVKQKLKKEFVLPQSFKFYNNGVVSFKFSSKIDPLDFQKMTEQFVLDKLALGDSQIDKKRNLSEEDDGIAQESVEVPKLNELKAITMLLKVTDSIVLELVPGIDDLLDKKQFTWELIEYSADEISLKCDWEHPESISVGRFDSMKITFENSKKWAPSMDESKISIPDGYTEVLTIPPQGVDLMTEEQIKDTQTQAQTFVLSNIILRTIFKQTMSVLFGSIIMIQILAHLPLASNLVLPANALETFDVLVGIVSFDFFQPTDYVDFGFTEMPPWSPNFSFLGYESVTFVEGMGSIMVFAFILVLNILLALLLVILKVKCCCAWGVDHFSPAAVSSNSLYFIHGVLFEVLICISCSMLMIQYQPWFNFPDSVSYWLQYIFMVILVGYILFVTYFTIFKSNKVVINERGVHARETQKVFESAHKNVRNKFQRRMTKLATIEEIHQSMKIQQDKAIKLAELIDENKLKKYEPLIAGVRKDSKLALSNHFFITIRRLTLLYMAMFILEWSWTTVLVFMVQNFLFLCFVLRIKPYTTRSQNNLTVLNESASLTVAYFILAISDKRNLENQSSIGSWINWTLYFSFSINILIIINFASREFYQKLRRKYYHRYWKRFKCCRPQVQDKKIVKVKGEKSKVKKVKKIDTLQIGGRGISSNRAQTLLQSWRESKINQENILRNDQSVNQLIAPPKYASNETNLVDIHCQNTERIELGSYESSIMDGVTNTKFQPLEPSQGIKFILEGHENLYDDFYKTAAFSQKEKMSDWDNELEHVIEGSSEDDDFEETKQTKQERMPQLITVSKQESECENNIAGLELSQVEPEDLVAQIQMLDACQQSTPQQGGEPNHENIIRQLTELKLDASYHQ